MSFKHPYKDGQIVIGTPNNTEVEYIYLEYYKRLEIKSKTDNEPHIMCPMCMRYKFIITYGEWKCIANCECGHKMTIYDG